MMTSLAIIVLGFAFRDTLSRILLIVGAAQMPLASFLIMVAPQAATVPYSWRLLYIVMLAVFCFVAARVARNRYYLYAFAFTAAVALYGGTVLGFRRAVATVGRRAITAFSWSIASLLVAFLISAHKANWLERYWPSRRNGHRDNEEEREQSEALELAPDDGMLHQIQDDTLAPDSTPSHDVESPTDDPELED